MYLFCFSVCSCVHRDLLVLTHTFPRLRSSDLLMPTRMKAPAALALILLGCRCEPPSAAEIAAARETRPALERIPLQIRSETGTHDFTVEVARTPEEQARGLMFRESLSSGAGMLLDRKSVV